MANLKLNQLAVPTFARIGVNGTAVTPEGLSPAEAEIKAPAGITPETGKSDPIAAGEFYDYLAQTGAAVQRITGSSAEPVRIAAPADSASQISVNVPENGSLTVIAEYPAAKSASGMQLTLAPYAKCKLVQVFYGGEPIAQTHAEIAENAEFSLTQIWLSGVSAVSGITAELTGRKAAFRAELGYLLTGTDRLDINLEAIHKGKKTQSEINVKGVLRDKADKIFRGTIDFQQGASGAKGAEREDVLLLDETVKNRTAPLILCAEEDVEGTHGATIGRLDGQALFYLQSRGIPEETLRELMAQARLLSAVRTIGDAETERRILHILGRDEDAPTA